MRMWAGDSATFWQLDFELEADEWIIANERQASGALQVDVQHEDIDREYLQRLIIEGEEEREILRWQLETLWLAVAELEANQHSKDEVSGATPGDNVILIDLH